MTHAGLPLDRAADGTVEAEGSAAAALAPHGIVPVTDEPPSAAKAVASSRVNDRRLLR